MKVNWEKLHDISQSKNISDKQLSLMIGRSSRYIGASKHNDSNLKVETVLALEKVLGVSASEFERKSEQTMVEAESEENQFEQNVLSQLSDLKEAINMIFELVDANAVTSTKETQVEKAAKLLKNMMPHNNRVLGVKYLDFLSRASVLGIKDQEIIKQAIDKCNCGITITGSATKQERWIVQLAE